MWMGILTTMMTPIPKRIWRAPGFPGGYGKGMRDKALPALFQPKSHPPGWKLTTTE
jgi:hypothetical protein